MDQTQEYIDMQRREKMRRDKISEVVSTLVDADIDLLTTYRNDLKLWMQILRELKKLNEK